LGRLCWTCRYVVTSACIDTRESIPPWCSEALRTPFLLARRPRRPRTCAAAAACPAASRSPQEEWLATLPSAWCGCVQAVARTPRGCLRLWGGTLPATGWSGACSPPGALPAAVQEPRLMSTLGVDMPCTPQEGRERRGSAQCLPLSATPAAADRAPATPRGPQAADGPRGALSRRRHAHRRGRVRPGR
jgi:hypothetical protein